MRWMQSEYMLKGIFLGLLLFAALQGLDWNGTGRVALALGAGAAAGLALAAFKNIGVLKRFGGKRGAFLLFVLLENPFLIYAGILGGMFAGVLLVRPAEVPESYEKDFLYCLVGGALLGAAIGELRKSPAGWLRFSLGLAVGLGIVFGTLWWIDEGHFADSEERRYMLGMLLLIGVPFFYVLAFTGIAEESEAEMAALCAVIAVAVQLIAESLPKKGPVKLATLGLLVPLALYVFYSLRILGPLRMFKHALRGYSFFDLGLIRRSLMSFRRAMELDPGNEMARQGLWKVHRSLDLNALKDDPETLQWLDLELCMARVAQLLVGTSAPTAEQREEAGKLLSLVESQEPSLQPQVDYYRAVSALHAGEPDVAAGLLIRLLDPSSWKKPLPAREAILFAAWQLALLAHPVMKQRVGETQLPLPGRRVEAIQSVERELMANPQDGNALSLRGTLYEGLTAADYGPMATEGIVDSFDYGYVEQIGTAAALDSLRWERGVEWLRIALHGQPLSSPSLYQRIIEACERAGRPDGARHYRTLSKAAGTEVGLEKFNAEEREIYFAQVKRLADDAAAGADYETAIAAYSVYTQHEKSGVETLRQLAEVYEKSGDVKNALRVNEKALIYKPADADLLARKDRYYYSLAPETLKEIWDEVKLYFDVKYCVTKCRQLLDAKNAGTDVVDWALHLIRLARVANPKDLSAMVQEARCRLRLGEREKGLALLEDAREMKPSGGDESDSWYFAVKQLGKLYLDEYARPDLAIPCFKDYQVSPRAGADTVYDLGRAYEANGQLSNAAKCYENVTGYTEHPLRWDAEEALRRVKEVPVS